MSKTNKQIILVHGWGGSIKSLEKLDTELTKKGFKCTRINLPGFGNTNNPPKTWGVFEYAVYVKEIIDKFRVISNQSETTTYNSQITTVFIGHSFGGSLGIVLASKYPDLIDKLILVAPSYKRKQQLTTYNSQIIKWESLPKTVKTFLTPFRYLYYKIFYSNSDLFLRPDLEENFKKIVTTDLTEEAKMIHIPTLILWGEKDTYTPLEHGIELTKIINKSEFKSFPNFTHSLPLQAPDEIVNIINNFINK